MAAAASAATGATVAESEAPEVEPVELAPRAEPEPEADFEPATAAPECEAEPEGWGLVVAPEEEAEALTAEADAAELPELAGTLELAAGAPLVTTAESMPAIASER